MTPVFSSPPAAYALLARDGVRLVGIAAYSFLWPAVGMTPSLYLKELYVGAAHRHRGVARLLMQALFEIADRSGPRTILRAWVIPRSVVASAQL